MSGERFDELAKDLAAKTTSRRRFLAGVAGAGATALLGPRLAGAAGGTGGSDCVNQGQSCTAQKCCQGLVCLLDGTSSTDKFCCTPLTPLVCGSRCCPTGALTSCVSGKCACPVGEIECPDLLNPAGKCINPLTDIDNCGGCGIKCGECFKCSNGICVPDPGKPCNDNNACTANDTCTATGACVGTPVVCDDGNPCTIDTCDPATGCVHTNVPNGTACPDDGNQCTDDMCQDGTCSHPAKPDGTACNDGNACTQTDTCQSGTCVGSNPVVCTPLDQCHAAGTCDPATGLCSNPEKPNGTACNDGNACTQTDTCQSGICVGSNPVVCTASDQCHVAGVCDPNTGQCSNPSVPNGTPCETGNPCTADTCLNGTCTTGSPVPNCCQTVADCPTPTNQCKQAACVSNVCTEQNKSNGTTCNDGNPCTTNDVCTGGVCSGTAVACPAGTTCVSGTCVCNTTSGCTGCCQSNTCQPGTAQGACGSNGVTCAACPTMGTGQQICDSQNNGGVFRCCRAAGRPCNPMNPAMCCSKSCPSATSMCSP